MKHVAKSHNVIYPLVSQVTSTPQHIVKDVVGHQFSELKQWFKKPTTARFCISHFGTFEPKIYAMRWKFLKYYIPQLRQNPTSELKREFKYWWDYRKLYLRYYYYTKQLKKYHKKLYHERSKAKKKV